MRKESSMYFLLGLILFFLFSRPTYAQDITIGNSSSYSNIETNIQGEGNVKTHIEVDVNGEKKVLDANKPGIYEFNVNLDTKTNDDLKATTKYSSPSSRIDDNNKKIQLTEKEEKYSLAQIVLKNIINFIKRIFNNL
ncbi:MAG: hypothetical protein AAB532_01485 [Patescibacteria group bacterium]